MLIGHGSSAHQLLPAFAWCMVRRGEEHMNMTEDQMRTCNKEVYYG